MYLGASTRLEAQKRMSYLADTSHAIASCFGGGKTVQEHFDSLQNTYEGTPSG